MGRRLGNGSPALGGAAGGFLGRPRTGPKKSPTSLSHTSSLAPLHTRPLPNRTKASLTRTEPRSQRDTQAARKWRPGPDGNCRRCRSARGSARQRRRRKEPSAPAPGCGRRAAGSGRGGCGFQRRRSLRADACLWPSALPAQACCCEARRSGFLLYALLRSRHRPSWAVWWSTPNPPHPLTWTLEGRLLLRCHAFPSKQSPSLRPMRSKEIVPLHLCCLLFVEPFHYLNTKKLYPFKQDHCLVKTVFSKSSRCHQTNTGSCFPTPVAPCQVEENVILTSVDD